METMTEQAKLWNGRAGHAWVDAQETIERMYRPFEDLLVKAVHPGDRVLDVGCGTGSVTLAMARAAGAPSTGVDISEPMIAAARNRAGQVGLPATFLCADAQSYPFEPASFDRVVSRFGVMFFDNPVLAFANLRNATADGGELQVFTWRSAAENPFMTTAERAAAPLLPNLPPRRPNVPGQFGFADPDRVRTILEGSGWSDIEVRPVDLTCTFPEPDLVRYLTRMGPVGQALHDAEEETRTRVVETVRTAFEPYIFGQEVRFLAATWLFFARK